MFTHDSFYWAFSAIAQVFGALSAILAVFLVYTLEWIQSSIEWSRRDLVAAMGDSYEKHSLDAQIENAKKDLSGFKKNKIMGVTVITAEHAIKVIENRREKRKEIYSQFSKVFALSMVIVGVSLSLIPIAHLFIKWLWVAVILWTLIIIVCGYSLHSIRKFIQFALERNPLS